MRIRLARGAMWSLPSWGRMRSLNESSPETEIDPEALSEMEGRILMADLASGVLRDADVPDSPLPDLASLPLPEFRTHVIHMTDRKALGSLLEECSKLGKGQHRKMVQGVLRGLQERRDDAFLPKIEIDPSIAEMGEIEDEEPAPETVAGLMAGYERWAKEEGRERNQESFAEFLGARSQHPDKSY